MLNNTKPLLIIIVIAIILATLAVKCSLGKMPLLSAPVETRTSKIIIKKSSNVDISIIHVKDSLTIDTLNYE